MESTAERLSESSTSTSSGSELLESGKMNSSIRTVEDDKIEEIQEQSYHPIVEGNSNEEEGTKIPLDLNHQEKDSSSHDRLNLVKQAVDFLKDTKVASSPVEKQVAFLKSKGLTSEEINEAIMKARVFEVEHQKNVVSNSASASIKADQSFPSRTSSQKNSTQTNMSGNVDLIPPQPPRLPSFTEREHFRSRKTQSKKGTSFQEILLGLIFTSSIGYSLYHVFKNYLKKFLPDWPLLPFEARSCMEELDNLATSVKKITMEFDQLTKKIMDQNHDINKIIQDIHVSLKQSKIHEDDQIQEWHKLDEKLNIVMDLHQKIQQDTKQWQGNCLKEWQQEIHSLKSLIIHKQADLKFPPSNKDSEYDLNRKMSDRSIQLPAWQLSNLSPEELLKSSSKPVSLTTSNPLPFAHENSFSSVSAPSYSTDENDILMSNQHH